MGVLYRTTQIGGSRCLGKRGTGQNEYEQRRRNPLKNFHFLDAPLARCGTRMDFLVRRGRMLRFLSFRQHKRNKF
jgi:hypothetical protein